MRGFFPTPAPIVDSMVARLFRLRPPQPGDTLLDPGCGTGAFIEGVIRWCAREHQPTPRITGVEADPSLVQRARQKFDSQPNVVVEERDFLTPSTDRFNYIIGNPPYVPITRLSNTERHEYRQRFRCATGRFDLYLLFFEQSLGLLRPGGRLVFITPEKFLYVETARPLRRELSDVGVEEIALIDESAFGNLITYPTITTVCRGTAHGETRLVLRDGTVRTARLSRIESWLPVLNGMDFQSSGTNLETLFSRISCGVATGADRVFILKDCDIPDSLRSFAFRTLSGRQLVPGGGVQTTHSMLVPYDRNGVLLAEQKLGALGYFLGQEERRTQLMGRTCVARKPWYAFHENPPLRELLQPKILCKDIGTRPWFVVDETGDVVPRHTVYYLIPKDASRIHELCSYLNSEQATSWLQANCQRAANGFARLQSHVLKRLPIPPHLTNDLQLTTV